MRKLWLSLVVLVVTALALSACGGAPAATIHCGSRLATNPPKHQR